MKKRMNKAKPQKMWAGRFTDGAFAAIFHDLGVCKRMKPANDLPPLRVVVLDARDYRELRAELKRAKAAAEWFATHKPGTPVPEWIDGVLDSKPSPRKRATR